MSEHFDADQFAVLDWKCTGLDICAALQDEYPDHTLLQSAAFEALMDELAMEGPQDSLERLGDFFAANGSGLWNIDEGGDGYMLALVEPDDEDEFAEHWEAQGCEVEFLGTPDDAEPIEPPVRAANPPELIEATFPHDEGLSADLVATSLARLDLQDDESDEARAHLVDFSVWPPRVAALTTDLHDVTPCATLASGVHVVALDREVDRRKRLHETRYAAIDAVVEPWTTRLWAGAEVVLEGMYLHSAHSGDTLFVAEEVRGELRIHRLNQAGSSVVFTARKPQQDYQLQALSPDTCLLATHDSLHVIGPARTTDTLLRPRPAPSTPLLAIGNDAFAYFSVNRHGRGEGPDEQVLVLHRCSLVDGRVTSRTLEEFSSTQTMTLSSGRRIRHRTFDGRVLASRAHDGWWVLNHATNVYGRRDLAWLWNAHTDEMLRIPPELFPRREPNICFVPVLNRFVASGSHRVDLLAPPAALIDALRAYSPVRG